MKQKVTNLYQYSEASDELKAKILSNNYYINVDYNWWESTYEDAENIGLKITGFDIDRGNYCKGEFMDSAEATAHKIEDQHGPDCETYKTAANYLKERDNLIDTWPKDEDGENENEGDLDDKLDDLDSDFLRAILEDYLSMLRNDYEYQTSEEAIIETIEANEYYFNEQGKIDTP